MAIDFPPNPSHGDVFGAFTYDENVPGWRSTPETASGMPAGSIMAWGSDVAPTNWLICNGSAVSRTTYASLFAAIGVPYGVGDGATTFNLPDLRGKVPVGKDSTQTEFDLLGETGGNKATAKYGDGTSTGYGATYSSSLGAGDLTASNLQPYQVVNYIIKTSAGVSIGDSELATRLGVVENKFNTGQNDVPAGSITQFAGSAIPTNWLLCDGSAVARATWPSLYSAIGTAYGAGDGSTTFNLPDIPNGDAAGTIGITRINSQINVTTVPADLAGASVTVNFRAGRTYRLTFESPNLNGSVTGRVRLNFYVNGAEIDRQYVSIIAGSGGTAVNVSTYYTPSVDGSVVVKMNGFIDAGSATLLTIYADAASTTILSVEDLGEAAGSALRTKSIIKATAGVATNESAFVTRVGAVETVNDTQNTRLANLEYNSPNYVINGAFDVWQRGTSFGNGPFAFDADRWMNFYDATISAHTQTQLALSPGEIPGFNGKYARRWNITSAGSGSTYRGLIQRIEEVRTLAGSLVTISFWAKADTNTRTITPSFYQSFGAGGSSPVSTAGSAIAISTSWSRYSQTLTLPSVSGKTIGANDYLELQLRMSLNTTMTIDVTGVQLEEGSTMTAFRRNANSIQGELAACQRYFQKSYNIETVPGTATGVGGVYSGGVCDVYGSGLYQMNFPVRMRATPTLAVWTYTGTANLWSYNRSGISLTTTSLVWDTSSWGGSGGGMIYAGGLGPAYTPFYIIGQWTASAEL